MKKLIFLSMFLVAHTAFANFSIVWANTQGGFQIPSDAGTQFIMPNVGDTISIQLLFSPDSIIDDVVFPGGFTNGNDVILDTRTITNVGGTIEEQIGLGWTFQYGGAGTPFLGPNVYMRVFSSGSIAAGDWFINSPMFTVTSKDFSGPAPVADIINFPEAFFTASQQVIPEPGTVALFLMGGVMMMIRHRRKRFLGR